MINNLDCSNIFPGFHSNYPDFGNSLNELCDGRLFLERYENGIDKYYDNLYSIIKSRDLADDLLGEIHASIYGTSRDKNEEKARNLIKKYEVEKQRKNI